MTDASGDPLLDADDVEGYDVDRYRPRIEGLFARIERWTDRASGRRPLALDLAATTSATVYGRDAELAIADPADPDRDLQLADLRDARRQGQRGRLRVQARGRRRRRPHAGARAPPQPRDDPRRPTATLKRIRYGNRDRCWTARARPHDVPATALAQARWLFEVVFDYGEHDADDPHPSDDPAVGNSVAVAAAGRPVLDLPRRLRGPHLPPLPARPDVPPLPRRARRRRRLPRRARPTSPTRESPIGSFVTAVTQLRLPPRRPPAATCARSLPPLELEYSRPAIDDDGARARGRREPREPARRASTGRRTAGSTSTARASPASSPSRPAPGSTSATSATARFGPLEPVAGATPVALARAAAARSTSPATAGSTSSRFDGPTPGLLRAHRRRRLGSRSARSRTLPDDRLGRPQPALRRPRPATATPTCCSPTDDAVTWHPSLGEDGLRAASACPALDEEPARALVFADGDADRLPRRHVRRRAHRPRADPQRRGLLLAEPRLRPLRRAGHDGRRAVLRPARRSSTSARLRLADIDGSGTDRPRLPRAATASASTSTESRQRLERAARVCAALPRVDDAASRRRRSTCSATAPPAWSGPRRCRATRAGRCATST